MTKPIFVDLNGSTARIDPQRTAGKYTKLTLVTEQAHDEDGNIVARGQASEIYITADQADALADALKSARAQP